MMLDRLKILLLLTFSWFVSANFAQSFEYIEVQGSVNAIGEIVIKDLLMERDSIAASEYDMYVSLKKAISLRKPIKVINKLAELKWELVTAIQLEHRPWIIYYFRRQKNE